VPLCTVHESKNQRDVQICGVSSPPVTVQDIVSPRRKKNEDTPDNLRDKCPMIVPAFFSHGIDQSTLNVVRLMHSSTSPEAASHISLYTC